MLTRNATANHSAHCDLPHIKITILAQQSNLLRNICKKLLLPLEINSVPSPLKNSCLRPCAWLLICMSVCTSSCSGADHVRQSVCQKVTFQHSYQNKSCSECHQEASIQYVIKSVDQGSSCFYLTLIFGQANLHCIWWTRLHLSSHLHRATLTRE